MYNPKTGKYAGKNNFLHIKKLLKDNPGMTGVRIAKELKLSLPTVYGHLAKLRSK